MQLWPVLPLARVHVLVEVLRPGVRALIREPDDLLDLSVDLLPDLLEVLLVGQPALLQLVFEGDDWIGFTELLLVLGGAVLVRVDDGVALEPVAEGLDEPRLRVGAGLLDALARL